MHIRLLCIVDVNGLSHLYFLTALADCTCSLSTQTKFVFERISASSSVKLAKRLRLQNEEVPSDDEFSEVSVNMVDKDTNKQPALELENSVTPDVYKGTRSR